MLVDENGNEISISDYFNRETALPHVHPEDNVAVDGPEVFEIEEDSEEEIFAAESLRSGMQTVHDGSLQRFCIEEKVTEQ